MTSVKPIQQINIIRHILGDDGTFPNNPSLTLLIYEKVLDADNKINPTEVKELLEVNGWANSWANGIYDYHHYHATTHEVLAIVRGSARVQFGGPSGVTVLFEPGDVVILPAGIAHKSIDVYDDFLCVGAYPEGYNFDMKYGKQEERADAIAAIHAVPVPSSDPVFGLEGPLLSDWISAKKT